MDQDTACQWCQTCLEGSQQKILLRMQQRVDVMAIIWKVWCYIRNPTRNWKNNSAIFYPDAVWNNVALGFWRVSPQEQIQEEKQNELRYASSSWFKNMRFAAHIVTAYSYSSSVNIKYICLLFMFSFLTVWSAKWLHNVSMWKQVHNCVFSWSRKFL